MLYSLTGTNNLKWGQKEQDAFESLKFAFVNSPVLELPNTGVPLILDTEVSDMAIGAEHCQIQNGEEEIVAYSSHTVAPEQTKHCATR